MRKAQNEPNRKAFSFKLDGELMEDIKSLLRQMPYQPKLTQFLENSLRKERDVLRTFLSGKKRNQ